jgi:hypothetical protein
MGLILIYKWIREKHRIEHFDLKSCVSVPLVNTGGTNAIDMLVTEEGMTHLIEKFKNIEKYNLDYLQIEYYVSGSDKISKLQFRIVTDEKLKNHAKLTIKSIVQTLLSLTMVLTVLLMAVYGLLMLDK